MVAVNVSFEQRETAEISNRDRWSSGDTMPNCLGEFREIREGKQRTGIAPYVRPAGTLGAGGVECLRPRENVQ